MVLRKSGVLAHPTSFPSAYGIGDLGKSAYDFVDFLKQSNQRLWQILPLGFTSFGDSPYQSFSTFAGNPYLVSPEELYKEELLTKADLVPPDFALDATKVDYGKVINYKNELLKKAYENFNAKMLLTSQYKSFCEKNKSWLEDFSLFMALKNYFIDQRKSSGESEEYIKYKTDNNDVLTQSQINDYYYGAVWNSWPKEIAQRMSGAVEKWSSTLKEEIGLYTFQQFVFFRQWDKLKSYANEAEVKIIGDIPIFVAMDSADTWSNPKLFYLKEDGDPICVAGVPPDYFSETGQLWGNPLYDWSYHKETGFRWWKDRIKCTLETVDILRIDHFRGFESYWQIEYGMPTAVEGEWVKGPGIALFEAVEAELGNLPIIAEDLGIITEEVTALREACGFPGMKVLQFGFDGSEENEHLPHNYTGVDIVVYSGTHDNDTTVGWYQSAPEIAQDHLRRYMNVSGEDSSWDLIRLAFSTVAETVIVPIWDIMRLDGWYRMNTPGVASGNWQFRYTEGMLTEDMANGLRYLSKLYARNI